MTDTKSLPGWSSAQWDLVNQAITEAFGKANVSGAFLPCYGPLADSAEYVRRERVVFTPGKRLKVEDDTTLKLFNLTMLVELSGEQVSEEGLSSALLAFRRAANVLGQDEDHIIFNGHGKVEVSSGHSPRLLGATVKSGPGSAAGLAVILGGDAEQSPHEKVELEKLQKTRTSARHAAARQREKPAYKGGEPPDTGEQLVRTVVDAITSLEDGFHPGPFVCVLGNTLFEEAHKPRERSMVLPADRITPLVKGALFRCGQLPKNAGVVVSLGGSDIDIVVATPPRAQFLQVTDDAKYLFRVYERFRLRIKDPTAVELFDIGPSV